MDTWIPYARCSNSGKGRQPKEKVRTPPGSMTAFLIADNHTEFYGLADSILLRALRILEKEKKAQIFRGNDADSVGVKFFR